jgi:hypothetical protein
MPEITDLAIFIDIHIEKGTIGSQDERYLGAFLFGFHELLKGKITEHIAVVADNGFVLVEEVFYVFEAPRGLQKKRFITKDNRPAPPQTVGKFLRKNLRAMMGVHDKPVYSYAQEMVHGVCNDRTPAYGEERFWTSLCQRAKSCPQSGA